MADARRILTLRHEQTGRLVPVEVPTVFGRSDAFYRYKDEDDRSDRLRDDVVEGLAALNYIKICSDDRVSRTHGIIDPRGPSIGDLNSTNGTTRNGEALPTDYGRRGPMVELVHGDAVGVGRQTFRVELWEVSEPDLLSQIRRHRHAVVASDHARRPRAERIKALLEERKGFEVRPALGWQPVIAGLYKLQAASHPEGLAVVSISAEAKGAELVLGDEEPFELAKLLPLAASVPGRKVVVLDVDGDPTACERRFAQDAYEDMVLLTSPGEVLLEDDLVAGSLRTDRVQAMRDSVDGASGQQGAYDDALDGLDALVGPDTNILDVSWIDGYRGRLKVVFGTRVRPEDQAISHSLRFGSTTFRF